MNKVLSQKPRTAAVGTHRGRSNTTISPPTFSSLLLLSPWLKGQSLLDEGHTHTLAHVSQLFTECSSKAIIFSPYLPSPRASPGGLTKKNGSLWITYLLAKQRGIRPLSLHGAGPRGRCFTPHPQLHTAPWRNYFHMLGKRTVSLFSKQRISTSEGRA